jgi:hypothetical protein
MAAPLIMLGAIGYTVVMFSGSPVRSRIFLEKLRTMKIGCAVWSVARVLRGVAGLYESPLFYGILIGFNNVDYSNFFIPTMLIIVYVIIEICPFLLILDWSFM